MTDYLTPKQRSELMSKVRGKDTGIEQEIRSKLHRKGFRFRKNVGSLPGKPDIVLRKYKAVILINGCFWHGHRDCSKAKLPSTRKEFWTKKISDNIERDLRNAQLLEQQGWRIVVLWQCRLRNKQLIDSTIEGLSGWITSNLPKFENI